MKTNISVDKMQCGSCVSTINSNLLRINGVFGVEANIAARTIVLDHTPDVDLQSVKESLEAMGYPAKTPQDNFAAKANEWDANPVRVQMANKFVRRVMELMPLPENGSLMDFGCGTGLVGLQFAAYVNKLVMVDNSPAMLGVLAEKASQLELSDKLELVSPSIEESKTEKVDAIVSVMAFHHVEEIEPVIQQMYDKLNTGGFLAIGDLISEDGSFHGEEKVPHNGFDTNTLCETLSKIGFQLEVNEIYNTISKPIESGTKDYPQFLIIVKK